MDLEPHGKGKVKLDRDYVKAASDAKNAIAPTLTWEELLEEYTHAAAQAFGSSDPTITGYADGLAEEVDRRSSPGGRVAAWWGRLWD